MTWKHALNTKFVSVSLSLYCFLSLSYLRSPSLSYSTNITNQTQKRYNNQVASDKVFEVKSDKTYHTIHLDLRRLSVTGWMRFMCLVRERIQTVIQKSAWIPTKDCYG